MAITLKQLMLTGFRNYYGSPAYARWTLEDNILPGIEEAEKYGYGDDPRISNYREIAKQIKAYLALAESEEKK